MKSISVPPDDVMSSPKAERRRTSYYPGQARLKKRLLKKFAPRYMVNREKG